MKMELKDALDLVLNTASDTANMFADGGLDAAHDEIKHAIHLLCEGSEKIEHNEDLKIWTCKWCGKHGGDCVCYPASHHSEWIKKLWHKTYTTHHKIEIAEVTSDPVFVEIGDGE